MACVRIPGVCHFSDVKVIIIAFVSSRCAGWINIQLQTSLLSSEARLAYSKYLSMVWYYGRDTCREREREKENGNGSADMVCGHGTACVCLQHGPRPIPAKSVLNNLQASMYACVPTWRDSAAHEYLCELRSDVLVEGLS